MLRGNKIFIAKGKEGTVYLISQNSHKVIYKKLSTRGKIYLPILKEFINKTKYITPTHFYRINLIENTAITYQYEELSPVGDARNMLGIIEVLKEVYLLSGMWYVDFGFDRNNIMKNNNGVLKIVDYGSGFLSNNLSFSKIKDKYYTFFFKPDYYKKLMYCWYLFHQKNIKIFNKKFLARYNSYTLNTILNYLLFLYLITIGNRQDKHFAYIIYKEDNFNEEFFNKLIKLFKAVYSSSRSEKVPR